MSPATTTSGADPSASAPAAEYPPADQSLRAARKLMGETRGTVKVIRRYVSVGIATWKIEAKVTMRGGPDFEIEIEGESVEETAFALLEALGQLGFTLDE